MRSRFQGYRSGWETLAALAFSDGMTRFRVAEITGWNAVTIRNRLAEAKRSGYVGNRRADGARRFEPHLWTLTPSGRAFLAKRIGLE